MSPIDKKWHGLKCDDCGQTIAYSPEPLNCYQPAYCYLCACSHAQVATWMMPIGNGLSTNSLYGMSKSGNALTLRARFANIWSKLDAKLEAHRVAKAYEKLHGSKNTT